MVGFDHRGFGKSEGKKAYIESVEQHLLDSKAFIKQVNDLYPLQTLPRFLLGLSMGGMTAYRLSQESPQLYRGAILMAPAILNLYDSLAKGVVKFAGSLFPKWNLLKQKFGIGTKNPKVSEDYQKDDLYYKGEMCPGTISAIF